VGLNNPVVMFSPSAMRFRQSLAEVQQFGAVTRIVR
jgi:hypothetical protein